MEKKWAKSLLLGALAAGVALLPGQEAVRVRPTGSESQMEI